MKKINYLYKKEEEEKRNIQRLANNIQEKFSCKKLFEKGKNQEKDIENQQKSFLFYITTHFSV